MVREKVDGADRREAALLRAVRRGSMVWFVVVAVVVVFG